MTDPFQHLSEEERDKLSRAKQPGWTAPMLATLVHEPFSDPQWLFERKLDGERVLAFRTRDGVRLMTRNRKRIEMMLVMAKRFDFWRDHQAVLARELREGPLVITPPPPQV